LQLNQAKADSGVHSGTARRSNAFVMLGPTDDTCRRRSDEKEEDPRSLLSQVNRQCRFFVYFRHSPWTPAPSLPGSDLNSLFGIGKFVCLFENRQQIAL